MIVVATTRLDGDGVTMTHLTLSMVVHMMSNMNTVLAITFKNITNTSPGSMSSVKRDSD